MTKIIAFLLISSTACANSKQETYYNSCYGSFTVAMVILTGESENKIRTRAKDLCDFSKEQIKSWDNVKTPMLLGCVNAMEMIYSPNMEPAKRKAKTLEAVGKFCQNIGNR